MRRVTSRTLHPGFSIRARGRVDALLVFLELIAVMTVLTLDRRDLLRVRQLICLESFVTCDALELSMNRLGKALAVHKKREGLPFSNGGKRVVLMADKTVCFGLRSELKREDDGKGYQHKKETVGAGQGKLSFTECKRHF